MEEARPRGDGLGTPDASQTRLGTNDPTRQKPGARAGQDENQKKKKDGKEKLIDAVNGIKKAGDILRKGGLSNQVARALAEDLAEVEATLTNLAQGYRTIEREAPPL